MSISKTPLEGTEGWEVKGGKSSTRFQSAIFWVFLASVEDWSLFLFQCFLLYLCNFSYLNSTAQGRVQRRWRRPFLEAHGERKSSSRQQFIQGKIRLGMIKHCLTMSTVKQHWIGLSIMGECSPQVPVSIRLCQAVFLLPFFFLVLSSKMGSFSGLPSSYQLSFWNMFRYF